MDTELYDTYIDTIFSNIDNHKQKVMKPYFENKLGINYNIDIPEIEKKRKI